MAKSPDAFRTISEVAELLDVPAHVLRFWESRFTQIKPIKRAGGRRYYRPADIELLAGIRKLLHEDGMTIRGVQKLLREEGVRRVAALASIDLGGIGPEDGTDTDGEPLEALAAPETAGAAGPEEAPMAENVPPDEEERRVVPFAPRVYHRGARATAGQGQLSFGLGDGAEDGDGERQAGTDPDRPEPDRPEPDRSGPDLPEPDRSGPDWHGALAAGAPGAEGPDGPPDAAAAGPAGAAPAPPVAAAVLPRLPPDPEDDDPAFAGPPLALSRLPRDPVRLRPVYLRLAELRRRMGDPARRAGPGG